MAESPISFDDLLQKSRQKRQAELLAQEIFGKNRRPRAPAGPKPNAGGSLASRVGVTKRTSSLPRSNTAPPRNGRRTPPAQLGRPTTVEKGRTKSTMAAPNATIFNDLIKNPVSVTSRNSGSELSIKGAAGGPHVVVAQNFAPGTTAADIESVMVDVGGQVINCHLIAINPTVIAEMTFVERSGADAVIAMFNNKKADGRTLHVYMKNSVAARTNPSVSRHSIAKQAESVPMDETMEVDENSEAREAEDRLREERRGRPDRGPAQGFPAGLRGPRGYEEDLYRGPRRAEAAYQDGRYGFDGGDNRYDNRGAYQAGGRLRSDDMRRGGQGWGR